MGGYQARYRSRHCARDWRAMTSRLLGLIGMIGVLALAAYYGLGQRHGETAQERRREAATALPVRTLVFGGGPVGHGISLVGVVRADEVAISPKVPSRIAMLHVREGDRVSAGQRLVTLDMGDMQAQLEGARAAVNAARAMLDKALRGKAARQAEMDGSVLEAEGQLELARAKLSQAELGVPMIADEAQADADKAAAGVAQAQAGLRQAEAGVKEAEDALGRLEELHRHGGVADVDLEGARSKAAMARSAADQARAALDLAMASQRPASRAIRARTEISAADAQAARSGVRLAEQGLRVAQAARAEALRIAEYDIAGARAQLDQARAGLRQAAASIGDSTLVSPIHGVVTALKGAPGEYAQPGIAIMTIVGSGPLRVETSAPIRLADAIQPGAPARVLTGPADTMGIATMVNAVGAAASTDGRSVPVTISLPRSNALKPGAMVTAVVTPGSSAGTRTLPREALMRDGGDWYAYVIRAGKASRRRVTIRQESGNRFLVRDGLIAGDRVISPLPEGIADGMPVRETSL